MRGAVILPLIVRVFMEGSVIRCIGNGAIGVDPLALAHFGHHLFLYSAAKFVGRMHIDLYAGRVVAHLTKGALVKHIQFADYFNGRLPRPYVSGKFEALVPLVDQCKAHIQVLLFSVAADPTSMLTMNTAGGQCIKPEGRYNPLSHGMKQELGIRIRVLSPPSGVHMVVQRGRDELVPPVSLTDEEIVFEFSVDVDMSSGIPNFLGKFAQGPKDGRFIYVNSGSYAAAPVHSTGRRAKISLMSITKEQIGKALAERGSRLETSFAGTAKDGGATCASVKGLVWKVVTK